MTNCICTNTMEMDFIVEPLSDNHLEMWRLPSMPDTAQYLLDKLNMCECCSEHKKNRPSVFACWQASKSVRKETAGKGYSGVNICECPCRHKARQICMTINNIPQDKMTDNCSEFYAYTG